MKHDNPALITGQHRPQTMTVHEFWEKGFLQEVNRKFLHPAGMAISVIIDKDTGQATGFGPIWDYRCDPEGLVNSDGFSMNKAKEYQSLIDDKRTKREENLGFFIQPCSVVDGDRNEQET